MENLDSRLLRNQEEEQDAAKELKEKKRGEAGEESGDEAGAVGEPRSLRQRVQSARQAMDFKQKAKDKIEEKVTAPIGMLKTKLLNFIPGYGPYIAFKNAVLMKKGKFTIVDILIMAFSNLNACLIILAALAIFLLICNIITNPLDYIGKALGMVWGAVTGASK